MKNKFRLIPLAALAAAACTGNISDGGGGTAADDSAAPADPSDPGDGADPDSTNGTAPAPFEAQMQRLTAAQYRHIIDDVFGAGLRVPPLEGEAALGGFANVGATQVGTSVRGVSLYETAARDIARQVFANEQRRKAVSPCAPANAAADQDCAGQLLDRVGRRLFRRPLDADERTRYLVLAEEGAKLTGSFWQGIELMVGALLQSPHFLYRSEFGEGGSRAAVRQLRGYELVSRLSFALHDTAPDDDLLDAAAAGTLDTHQGLAMHATRLLEADRATARMRSFFSEMFKLPTEDTAEARALREETLLVLAELESQDEPYTRIFEASFTFVNDTLAARYGLPDRPGTNFTKVDLPDGPRLGLLGHAAILHEGKEEPNPITRGKFIREALLCHEIAPPPPGLNVSLPPNNSQDYATARDRLAQHREDPACSACHAMMDPLGLALEHFDGFGRYRDDDHGLPIDPSGDLDGRPFADARELARVLASHEDTRRCLVASLRRSMTGQLEGPEHEAHIAALDEVFARKGESVRALVEAIVLDESFRTVAVSQQ